MNLITGTDAPLTEEEIVNVATPTMTPTTGAMILRDLTNNTTIRF